MFVFCVLVFVLVLALVEGDGGRQEGPQEDAGVEEAAQHAHTHFVAATQVSHEACRRNE